MGPSVWHWRQSYLASMLCNEWSTSSRMTWSLDSILFSDTTARVQLHPHNVAGLVDQSVLSVSIINFQLTAPKHHSKKDGADYHRLKEEPDSSPADVEGPENSPADVNGSENRPADVEGPEYSTADVEGPKKSPADIQGPQSPQKRRDALVLPSKDVSVLPPVQFIVIVDIQMLVILFLPCQFRCRLMSNSLEQKRGGRKRKVYPEGRIFKRRWGCFEFKTWQK